MGSKGSPTVTNTAQSYMANPVTAGAATQAIQGAETAAAQPFQMPVAPVAGFNPTQTQAFQQFGNMQNSWQPAFAQGEGYTAQSAAPITAADVNNVYNPMAANVTAQLQNIFGQQNVQNQGDLTAKAGGVGADRIAVGMGDLANQQGLAAGQTYSNLYQQALQTAMQEKQLQAGAGSQFQSFGTGTLGNNIQQTGALLGAGNQQQQQTQAQLNAPYQNTLAQIAYQFQTPQYLAGIAGGLAPALGGTTNGNQITTPPQPTIASQILGLGTAGVGAYGAFGGNFSPSQIGSFGNMQANSLTDAQANAYGMANNLTPYAEGGNVDDSSSSQDPGPAIPGVHIPKSGGFEPIPLVSLPQGAGHSGPLTGAINTAPPQQQSQGQQETFGGDLTQALGLAAKIVPFLKRGGAAHGYDDGGDVPYSFGDGLKDLYNHPENYLGKSEQNYSLGQLAHDIMGKTGLSTSAPAATAPTSFNDRFNAAFPNSVGSSPNAEANPNPVKPGTTPLPRPSPVDAPGSHPEAFRLDKPGDDDEAETPAQSAPASYAPNAPFAVKQGMMPTAQQPYPDALQRDKGQDIVRSPWMALIKAGATIASTPGNLGTSIGKGILAGAGTLEGQRKELRSEQDLNDKAQQLYQTAQQHLDKYTKVDANTQAEINFKNRELDQYASNGTAGGVKEIDVQRAMTPLNTHPTTLMLPPDEKRILAIHALRTGSYVGAEKTFKDGVVGVWDGQKWGPKGQ